LQLLLVLLLVVVVLTVVVVVVVVVMGLCVLRMLEQWLLQVLLREVV
jgi:hypothetical protein